MDKFSKCWPFTYGKGRTNSRAEISMVHAQCFSDLISYVWPANTNLKFMRPQGFPKAPMSRPAFHSEREAVCESK